MTIINIWWNREAQITEFVKQWIPAQLHSEADASKDGQIRPHMAAGYENLAGFRPGPDMISGATLKLTDNWAKSIYRGVFLAVNVVAA